MKTVLCFGDSNTHGYIPGVGRRYEKTVRWPGKMAELLGPEYEVIEEGLNSRTTVFEDPMSPGKNGLSYLVPCLASHAPIDLVILLLGSNDLKSRFGVGAIDIARGMECLVATVQKSGCGRGGAAPEILVVSPTALGKEMEMFAGAVGMEKQKKLAPLYREMTERMQVHFFDAATVANPSPADGLHLEKEDHAALAQAMGEAVRRIL